MWGNDAADRRGEIWDAGKYKEKNMDIIEKLSGGRERVRFK